tara:strand:+ start:67 stop:1122 length:1056 start_codon:yes stop_codon:yes gene_type:complete
MSRILRRPMFRGGSSNRGITTGLGVPKRGLVDGPGSYAGMDSVKEQLAMLDENYPSQGSNINDFLISMGLNLVSSPPTGNIFQTAASSAKGPFKEYLQSKRSSSDSRRAEAAALLSGQLNREAEAKKSGVKMQMIALLDQDYTPRIEKIKTSMKVLEQKHGKKGTDGSIVFEDKTVEESYNNLNQELNQTQSEWDVKRNRIIVPGKSKAAQILEVYASLVKAAGETSVGEAIDFEELMTQAKKQVESAYREGNAVGGRVGFDMGGSTDVVEEVDVREQIKEEPKQKPSIDMSYAEFRKKMDAQVTDDVVQLVYYNPTAFADFANIETQEDVYEFNNKYNVNLVLPFNTSST